MQPIGTAPETKRLTSPEVGGSASKKPLLAGAEAIPGTQLNYSGLSKELRTAIAQHDLLPNLLLQSIHSEGSTLENERQSLKGICKSIISFAWTSKQNHQIVDQALKQFKQIYTSDILPTRQRIRDFLQFDQHRFDAPDRAALLMKYANEIKALEFSETEEGISQYCGQN